MRYLYTFFILLIGLSVSFSEIGSANAPPQYFIVRGKLVDGSLLAKQGSYDIRASLWLSADALDADPTDITGNLWWDIFTVTLEADGRFEVHVGQSNALPNPFSFDDYKYIQLDAKPSAASVYNILDPISTNNTVDRLDLLTLDFKSTLEDFFGSNLSQESGINLHEQ